ncbi:MAG TPA: hypothetical protein VN685_12635, partial [Rhizomicrobium sp.]|nr:hypothetical protein [Rhizomicrobium sp.]
MEQDAGEREKKAKPWWHNIVIIAVGLLAAGVAKVATQGLFDYANRPSKAAVEKAIDNLTNQPTFGELYQALQKYFPDDYAQMRSQMADIARQTTNQSEIRTKSQQLTQQFFIDHLQNTSEAPAENLYAVAKANDNLITALKAENIT